MTKETKQDNSTYEALKKAITPKIDEHVKAVREAGEQIVRLEKAREGYQTKRDTLDGEITQLTIDVGDLLTKGRDITKTEASIREKKAAREEADAWVSRLETELIPAAKERLQLAEKELTAVFGRAIDQERPACEEEMNKHLTAATDVFHDFLEAQKGLSTKFQVKTGFRRLELIRWDVADHRFQTLIKNLYGHLFG